MIDVIIGTLSTIGSISMGFLAVEGAFSVYKKINILGHDRMKYIAPVLLFLLALIGWLGAVFGF